MQIVDDLIGNSNCTYLKKAAEVRRNIIYLLNQQIIETQRNIV